MAKHDWVVRRIAKYFRDRGEAIQAGHLRGYKMPPTFIGERGGRYKPDVYLPDRDVAYEVEDYHSVMNSIPQIKAFYRALGGKRVVVVLCTGTDRGARQRKKQLAKRGVKCRVLNYAELRFW